MLFENDSSYGALGEMCSNTSRRLGANARGTCPVDIHRYKSIFMSHFNTVCKNLYLIDSIMIGFRHCDTN